MTRPDITRIHTGRFEQSPFREKYDHADAIYGVYAGRYYPADLGQDAEALYWELRRGVVLYDVPERPIQIAGADAARLLDKVFTRPVSNLKPGKARYAIACLPNGGILMDGIVMRLGEDQFWYVQANGEFDTWLVAHGTGIDVAVSDPKSWVMQVQGPKSLEVLKAATDGQLDESLGYFNTARAKFGGQEMLISRTGWTGEVGFELYTDPDTDCPALWDHLMACGQPLGLVFSDENSMNIRRIEAGILNNLTDIDQSMTPFDAGLGAFVDLDHEGFIGREALMTASREARLLGLYCAGATPSAGMEVLNEDTKVGILSAGAWSPFLGIGIGYVRFGEAGDWTWKELQLKTDDGNLHPCEAVPLPLYDPEKKIPRLLDKSIP